MKTPSVSIFYVTYARDLEFFRHSIRSVSKFARGFKEVVVLVPMEDVQAFSLCGGMPGIPMSVIGYEEVKGKGMLHHEAQVLSAEKFCEGDFILHMDSDVVFWEDCTPDDFVVDGKPILYREKFENFKHYAARYSWKKCVKDAIGIDPEWETMVRHPAVHPRWIYPEVRFEIEQHTGKNFLEYVLSCENSFPQTFAEYPTIGAYALQQHPELYKWVDYEVKNPDGSYDYRHGKDKVKAFWSHGGIDPVRAELEIITR